MAPAVIDLNAELEETVIADPRTGGDVNVNVELLLRYLRDPKGLSLVRERTWNALGKRDWSSDERQAAVTQEWFDLITTDGFLYPNRVLEEQYDSQDLLQVHQ